MTNGFLYNCAVCGSRGDVTLSSNVTPAQNTSSGISRVESTQKNQELGSERWCLSPDRVCVE